MLIYSDWYSCEQPIAESESDWDQQDARAEWVHNPLAVIGSICTSTHRIESRQYIREEDDTDLKVGTLVSDGCWTLRLKPTCKKCIMTSLKQHKAL